MQASVFFQVKNEKTQIAFQILLVVSVTTSLGIQAARVCFQ